MRSRGDSSTALIHMVLASVADVASIGQLRYLLCGHKPESVAARLNLSARPSSL